MRYLAMLVLVVGCVEYGDNRPPPEPPLTPAERAWLDEALPVFQALCMACHAQTAVDTPDFLAGETPWEIRDNLLASGTVNLDDPARSRLFVKGVHSGPAMSSDQISAILDWIEAERDERP